MSQVSGVGASASAASSTQENDLNGLDLDDFLQLLITELQNQDPLNPVENSETLQQIGQIREIGATNALTNTLSNLSISQQLTTASSLIGREVVGLSEAGSEITGLVSRVTVETEGDGDSRNIKVRVGDETIDVKNIREVNEG